MKYWLIILLLLISIPFKALTEKEWKKFGDLNEARVFHRALVLDSERTFVMGGGGTGCTFLSTCEMINIRDSTIVYAASMTSSRQLFTALFTPDSNIIVAGGQKSAFSNTDLIEIFDVKKNTWTIAGHLLMPRSQHIAFFINDSEMVVVGGLDDYQNSTATAEIFNLKSAFSSYINNFPYPINSAYADISSNNTIIISGGRSGGANSPRYNHVFTFDKANKNWVRLSDMPEEIQNPTHLKLLDGRILVSGGSRAESPLDFTKNVIIEDNNVFKSLGFMTHERQWHGMAQFRDDSVIVAGGYDNQDLNYKSCEWINLKTNEISPAPDMIQSKRSFQMTSQKYPSGSLPYSILAIGGGDDGWNPFSIVEILFDKIQSKPIAFALKAKDCGKIIYTISSESLIELIQLIDSSSTNVTIQIEPDLPSKKVEVTVELIDDSTNGYFALKALSNLRQNQIIIKDTITSSKNVIRIIGFPSGDIYHTDEQIIGEKNCIDFIIENYSDQAITLSDLYFLKNTEFSLPQSQIPCRINAKDSFSLRICFESFKLGYFQDTLFIHSLCPLSFPLDAFCLQNKYTAESQCKIKLKFETDQFLSDNVISISPNPAGNFIEIIIPYVILNEVKRRNEVETSEANPGIKIYNIYGEEINLTNQHSSTPPFGHPFELEGEAARIDVSAFPPGVYFVRVGDKVGKFVKM